MNGDTEEREIRRLYSELRREDERLTLPFDSDWNAALSRRDTGRRDAWLTPRRAFRLYAATAAALILLGGLALVFLERSSGQKAPSATPYSVTKLAQPHALVAAHPENLTSAAAGRETTKERKSKPDSKTDLVREHSKTFRRLRGRPQPTVSLISHWRSPTDFLLDSSGTPLLKTVPRLDESLVEIKTVGLGGND